MFETTEITIQGDVTGALWWPVGAKTGHPAVFSVTDYEARCVDSSRPGEPVKLTLREAVLAMLMHEGGNYQGGDIADGVLTVERTDTATGRRRSRSFPLTMFPSIADCRDDEWDGIGDFGGEDEE